MATRLTKELSLGRNFTRPSVDKIITELGEKIADYVILDESLLRSTLQIATARPEDKLKELSIAIPSNQFSVLYSKTKELNEFVPGLSQVIDHLQQNLPLAKWVESGLTLHEGLSSCEFCGQKLTETRIHELQGHFSKEFSQHKQKLESHLGTLKEAVLTAPNLRSSDFYPQFRSEFEHLIETLTPTIEAYNSEIQKLISLVETKISNPFSIAGNLDHIQDRSIDAFSGYTNLQEIIEKHNSASSEFEKRQATAVADIKNHNVASFVAESSYASKLEESAQLITNASNLDKQVSELEKEILNMKAQISSSQKGREKLNDFILKFLGKDNLMIDVISDEGRDRFVLKRGNVIAKNLSEGEKTAVAFSHFLVKLTEIQNIVDAIICIDDPISSLDNNHIFQVTALLKDHLFERVPQPSNPTNLEWKLKCSQLFLSTHNFEFLGLLKEIPTEGYNKFHATSGKTVFYMFQVDQHAECRVSKLPNSLRQTETEYHYLFELLDQFSQSSDRGNYDNLLILPNAFRRFVELYTYAKIPLPIAVDQRAEKLFGIESSKRILKVLHHFSHSRFDRINKHNDLICDLGDAVDELFTAIETTDKDHIDALRSL